MVDLIGQITTFANDHRDGCSAYVKCLAPRKPPGFSAATSGLYFNLKTKEQLAEEAEATSQLN